MILNHLQAYRGYIELFLDGWQSRNKSIYVVRVDQNILPDYPDDDLDEMDGYLKVGILIENKTELLDEELADKWAQGIGRRELINALKRAGIPESCMNSLSFDMSESGYDNGCDIEVRFEANDVADYVRMTLQQSPVTNLHLRLGHAIAMEMGMRDTTDKYEIIRKLLSAIKAHGKVRYEHILAAEYLYSINKWPELQAIIKSGQA